MIVLDTDHISVLKYTEDPRCARLKERLLAATGESIATTIVTAEEQMRGWLARIHGERRSHRLVPYYSQLAELFDFFKLWRVLPFDRLAADHFDALLAKRLRVGTQDLKIAAIAISRDALLLTGNRRDFARVPDLRMEDWLD